MAHDFSFANIKMAWSGEIMLRIMATEDNPLHGVKQGDLGGWVAESAEVAVTAWVGGDAEVFANAKVLGSALVTGNSKVFGNINETDDPEKIVTVCGTSVLRDTLVTAESLVDSSELTGCVVTDASYVHYAKATNTTISNSEVSGSGYDGMGLNECEVTKRSDLERDGLVFSYNIKIDPADLITEPSTRAWKLRPEVKPAEPAPAPAAAAPEPKPVPTPKATAEPKPRAGKKFVQKATPLAEKLGQGELKFEPVTI